MSSHSAKSKRRPAKTMEPPEEDRTERLQKILAAAGLGSRRECEELILQGRVEVDGRFITELGAKANPDEQEIRVDGTALPRRPRLYFMINKPPGVLSTSQDPSGRPRVIDLAPEGERLFAVGRLDKSSQGLILATNDGDLANRLTHPRYGVEKIYNVEVVGHPTPETMKKLLKGIHLAEGMVQAAEVHTKKWLKTNSVLRMTLREGRNREIRRMLASLGHKVVKLTRVAIGPVKMGELPLGACRALTKSEVQLLYDAAKRGAAEAVRSRRPRGTRIETGAAPLPKQPRPAEKPARRAGPVLLPDADEFGAAPPRTNEAGPKRSKPLPAGRGRRPGGKPFKGPKRRK